MEYGIGGTGFEKFLRDSEQRMAQVGEMKERIAETVGRGESMDGRIKAEFTSADGLAALDLDPRALRVSSDELSEAIRTAVNAASKDFQARLTQVTGEMFGMPADPMNLVRDPEADMTKLREHAMAQGSKLGDAFAGQMKDILRELTMQQQRTRESMERYRGPGQRP